MSISQGQISENDPTSTPLVSYSIPDPNFAERPDLEKPLLCEANEVSIEEIQRERARKRGIAVSLREDLFQNELSGKIDKTTEQIFFDGMHLSEKLGDRYDRISCSLGEKPLNLNEFILYKYHEGFFGKEVAIDVLLGQRDDQIASPIIEKQVYSILNLIRFHICASEVDGTPSAWADSWNIPAEIDPDSFYFESNLDQRGINIISDIIQNLVGDDDDEDDEAIGNLDNLDDNEGPLYYSLVHQFWDMFKGYVAVIGGTIAITDIEGRKRIDIYGNEILDPPSRMVDFSASSLMIMGRDLDINIKMLSSEENLEESEGSDLDDDKEENDDGDDDDDDGANANVKVYER